MKKSSGDEQENEDVCQGLEADAENKIADAQYWLKLSQSPTM